MASASERATLSVGPPAAKGTTILMGFEGKLSALCAEAENATADIKAPSVSENVFILAPGTFFERERQSFKVQKDT
jgi:hypothetical protein